MRKSLKYFQTIKDNNSKVIVDAKALINNATSFNDLVTVLKALEIVEEVKGTQEFDDVVFTLLLKVQTLEPNSSDDLLMLSRITKFNETYSYGDENVALSINDDRNNVNHKGEIIIGQRKLENFGDVQMETFYASNI